MYTFESWVLMAFGANNLKSAWNVYISSSDPGSSLVMLASCGSEQTKTCTHSVWYWTTFLLVLSDRHFALVRPWYPFGKVGVSLGPEQNRRGNWRWEHTLQQLALRPISENVLNPYLIHETDLTCMHARARILRKSKGIFGQITPRWLVHICLYMYSRYYNFPPSETHQHQCWRRERTVLDHVVTWDPFTSWIFIVFRQFIASQAHQASYAFQAYRPNRFESCYAIWASACRYALCTIGTTLTFFWT